MSTNISSWEYLCKYVTENMKQFSNGTLRHKIKSFKKQRERKTQAYTKHHVMMPQ